MGDPFVVGMSADDVLDSNRNARQRPRLARNIQGEIFESLEHRLDGQGLLATAGCVLIRGGVIALEQAQQFENPGVGFASGARVCIRHVGKS
jgi:hypothetical protein